MKYIKTVNYRKAFEEWARVSGLGDEGKKTIADALDYALADMPETYEIENLCKRMYEWRSNNPDRRAPEIAITKSNLLARMIYGGEPLRTVPCPVHQGQWSGCVWHEERMCPHCMSGADVTGWVREEITMRSKTPLDPDTPLPIVADWLEEHGITENLEWLRSL